MTDIEEKTEYAFAELSEKAKGKARDALRYTEHYLDYDWWDDTYDDVGRIATILGITFDTKMVKLMGGKSRPEPCLYFSGFSSQGDGACFTGHYAYNPKAAAEINAYCNDKALLGIATELYVLQLARRLRGLEPFTATSITTGRYSHSGSMSVEVHFEEDEEDPLDAITDEVTNLMRAFADWIYKSLEAERDYLMSDAVVDQQLEEETFDEEGDTI